MARGHQTSRQIADAGTSLEERLSPHMLCPISHCLMEQPVVAPSGHTYDYDMISAWLVRRPVDPLSGAPLTHRALYPNRALQKEIVDQLEKLAERAEATGHSSLAEAAKAKLETINAGPQQQPEDSTGMRVRRLDSLIDNCARWATWWGEFAREQTLVYTTSLGAMLCLIFDAGASYHARKDKQLQPQHLLATFIHLAVIPTLPPPRTWHVGWRFVLHTLRSVLLLPVVPTCMSLVCGGVLSLLKFGRRFAEVRAMELERAGQSQWWVRIRDLGSSITGMTSILLFMRIWMDSRGEFRRRGT